MKLNNFFKAVASGATEFARKNGYVVLGVGAMLGLAGSIVLTYKIRPKVDEIITENKKKIAEIDLSDLSAEIKKEKRKEVTRDTITELLPVAAPLGLCTLATVGCMGGTIAFAARRIDDLASIARVGDIAYNNLYQSTREVVGDEKANEIKMKSTEKDMTVAGINPYDGAQISYDGFIVTHHGDTPLYDAVSGRLFKGDLAFIEATVAQLNIELLSNQAGNRYMAYNEYGKRIGLPYSMIGEGRFWIDQIVINSANAMPWGDGSVRIIDFMTRPILVSPQKLQHL